MTDNMERFTARAQRVMQLAEAAAAGFQHQVVGTEHVLLGMLREGGGVASHVLHTLNVEEKAVEDAIRALPQDSERFPSISATQLAPQTKKMLALAIGKARRMGHPFFGTEHLLLGLLNQADCTAISILKQLNIDPEQVRTNITSLLEENAKTERAANNARRMRGITERFTQRARRVLSWAQEKSEQFEHNHVGPEHILLGLICESHGIAARALRDLELQQQSVEDFIRNFLDLPTQELTEKTMLSNNSLHVLEFAVDEARRMGHPYIGTEHLLLAIVRQPESKAVDVLMHFGVSPFSVQQAVKNLLQTKPVETLVPQPPADIAIPTMNHAETLHFHVIEQFIAKLLGMVEDKSLTFDQAKELLVALQPQLELLAGESTLAVSQINHMNANDKRKITLEIKAKNPDVSTWNIEVPVAQALLMLDDLMVAAANHRAFITTFEGSEVEVRVRLDD